MSEQPKFLDLPTGKPHVSFSEVKEWAECSFRHKLHHIDRVGTDLPSVHMDFGTAIHAACEHLLKTRETDKKIFLKTLYELWTENSKIEGIQGYDADSFKDFARQGVEILPEVKPFLDATFPEWEYIDAEHQLYEPIEGFPHAFKGFIDGIIKCKGPRNKNIVWLLDWKGCSFGWNRFKREDDMVKAQLVYYKNFWSKKVGVDPKDIRCGFILLKRTAKPGSKCELFTVSVGDVTTQRSLRVLNNMVASVKRGIAIKNREACRFCEFKETKWCP